MDPKSNLKIIQWNVRSVRSNLDNINNLITEERPDLLLLNETFLTPDRAFNLKTYNIIRQDRPDGYGGVATCVKNNLCFKVIKKFCSDNIQYIIINLGKIYIINIYCNSNLVVDQTLLKALVENFNNGNVNSDNDKIVIMGDFNSHHPLWDNAPINRGGRIISDFLLQNNLIVLNDGSATLLNNVRHYNVSAVDLSLVSNNLALNALWSVIRDCGNSDHFPTKVTLNSVTLKDAVISSYVLKNFKKANWEMYFDKTLTQLILNNDDDNINYDTLIEILNLAAKDSIPFKNSGVKNSRGNPWWDDECSLWVQERKECVQRFNNFPSIENFINVKKTMAIVRKRLRIKKKEKFIKFCHSLNRTSNVSYIWKKIKKFSNKDNASANKEMVLDNDLKTNILRNMSSVNIDPLFQMIMPVENKEVYTFTIQELDVALQNKENSSPGMDDLAYSMFKELPRRAKQILVNIYNKILLGDPIPYSWKRYNIICLLKPNKDPKLANSYRPIVLASCACKILEIIIKNRIDWLLEHNNVFSQQQLGFRKGRGVVDNTVFLSSFVFNAFLTSETVLSVFLDIKAAYDNVNIYKLYNKVNDLGIPIELNNVIHKIIRNRLIYTRNNDGSFLGPFLATKGIPQGSPLSTILFNIYVADLFDLDLGDAKIIGYADDLVVFVKGKDITSMVHSITDALVRVNDFLRSQDLSLATDKCEAVWFTKGGRKVCPPPIRFDDQTIEYKTTVKYLGTFFHKNLKWDTHIEYITNKAKKALNILKAVCRVWWGADPTTLLTFFQALVLSHLDFGSTLFRPVSQGGINKLNVVFYEGLRICLGCMRSTPRVALLAEASMMDLEQRRKNLTVSYLKKIVSIQNHPIVGLILESRRFLLSKWGHVNVHKVTYHIEMMGHFLPYINKIYKSLNLPCYEVNFDILIDPVKTFNCGINKKDNMIKEKFLAATERYKNTFTFVYTDASKKDNRVGYGFSIPLLKFKFSARLNDLISICKAEIIAIHEATKTIINKKIKKSIIFSDSKSAIQKINNNLLTVKADYWTLRTKRLILEGGKNGFDIRLAWIPGHSDIPGNDEADTLANIGRILNIPKVMNIDASEIYNKIKSSLKESFKQNWLMTGLRKNYKYMSIQNMFPERKWFSLLPFVNRRHITTIIRMRTGHCLTGEMLYKFKIADTPFCDCGQIDNLNHIFFECPINKIHMFDLYEKFSELQFPSPITIGSILAKPSVETIKLLMYFINHNKLKL